MEALQELGLEKSLKFIFFKLASLIYFLLFLLPFQKIFLQIMGAKIGKNSILIDTTFINAHQKGFSNLKIGKECFIGNETMLDLYNNISLEDKVTLAPKVLILTHTNIGYSNHPLQKLFPKSSAPVLIKSGSFVGAGSIILPGVIIGEQSFVAAGSVVTKDVPDNSLFGGVPAKLIRKL